MKAHRTDARTMREAYLDIETTGLSWPDARITVIGVYLADGNDSRLVQLVDKDITADNLHKTLDGVGTIYSYNGRRFDLPFIDAVLGIRLDSTAEHHDLMYDCWRCNLFGGLKAVERQLGIPRQLQGITGWDAVLLWQRYADFGDRNALDLLLHYNEEDVTNLKLVQERLRMRSG